MLVVEDVMWEMPRNTNPAWEWRIAALPHKLTFCLLFFAYTKPRSSKLKLSSACLTST
jgi:hypothetical protein